MKEVDIETEAKKRMLEQGAPRKISKKILIIALIFFIVLFFVLVIWLLLNSYRGCDTWECFNERLSSCSKTRFAGGKDIIFGYKIMGKDGNLCKIEVEYLQGDIADQFARKLENKKMKCYLPEGVIMLPESELKNCHGLLKEKLQEQVISQLHNFIVQNIGQINKALLNPLDFLNETS